MLDVDPHIKETLYKTIFTVMHLVTEDDMKAIVWEMLKEVNNQILLHEDEFYHVSDLQYFVHTITPIDVAHRSLVITYLKNLCSYFVFF